MQVDPGTAKLTEVATFAGESHSGHPVFWGGDHWTFASSIPGEPSPVTKFDTATKTATVVVEDTGLEIVGAAASVRPRQVN